VPSLSYNGPSIEAEPGSDEAAAIAEILRVGDRELQEIRPALQQLSPPNSTITDRLHIYSHRPSSTGNPSTINRVTLYDTLCIIAITRLRRLHTPPHTGILYFCSVDDYSDFPSTRIHTTRGSTVSYDSQRTSSDHDSRLTD
jgi:hypothetical protein